jgi:transposase
MGAKRKRRHFTPEYKAEVVRLAQTSGKTAGQIARELDLTQTAVREWIKQADVDAGKAPNGALTTAEREELHSINRSPLVLYEITWLDRPASGRFE